MQTSTFIFDSYAWTPAHGELILRYSIQEMGALVHFEERLLFPGKPSQNVDPELLDRVFFNLHLIGGISYYKTSCPPKIEIRSGTLSPQEAAFWDKLYTQGLGEFFYDNDIDFRGLVQFPAEAERPFKARAQDGAEKILLPWGGGKDSVVSAELLKRGGHDFELIHLGEHEMVRNLAEITGKPLNTVHRELSPELFRLNDAGALNGHVPISAYIAFMTVAYSLLYGYRWVVLSNEASANEGNVEFYGVEINHQYSKSLEFERDFSAYLKSFLTPSVGYFSLLRPLHELAIARLFAQAKPFFEGFSSCNKNFKILGHEKKKFWCKQCPKCAFVFVMLAPYIGKDVLLDIFGGNLLEDASLWPLYEELLGVRDIKPFECVGTPHEVRRAFRLVWSLGEYDSTPIMKHFIALELPLDEEEGKLLDLSLDHDVPDVFLPLLKPRVLVLGEGKEGKAVLDYGQAQGWDLTVADSKQGPEYLDALDDYDFIVKSPGIPWHEPIVAAHGRVTSGTQLFFDHLHPSNTVIGITGSKGKSTVSTLIYKVLEAAGLPVRLIGNIGEPALRHLHVQNEILVMELSSYQLDRLVARPHIAVFTSFFPEHLNVHGNLENYLRAKAAITRWQEEDDFFVFNEKYPELKALNTQAQKVMVKGLSILETPLLGDHNKENLLLVERVAELFDIPEELVQEAVRGFGGLPHRLEYVGTYEGIRFYDDAISTTPESTLAALSIFGAEIQTLFLGGEDRGLNFEELAKKVAELAIPNLVLFPETGVRIRAVLPKGYEPNILETRDMQAAVDFAYKNTGAGGICLLSTASPSYGVWKNFEEKGDLFKQFVRAHIS
jgi:UDP-N-acetylmuramoylalanine-D-glutamate ligase